jgi:hypothetical protein
MTLLLNYIKCFTFSFLKIGQLKQQEVHIILEDDNPIFRRPYNFNEVERTLVQIQTLKLLDTSLVFHNSKIIFRGNKITPPTNTL